MEVGIVAFAVAVITAWLTYAARSRGTHLDELRFAWDMTAEDRDHWRSRALECEAREREDH